MQSITPRKRRKKRISPPPPQYHVLKIHCNIIFPYTPAVAVTKFRSNPWFSLTWGLPYNKILLKFSPHFSTVTQESRVSVGSLQQGRLQTCGRSNTDLRLIDIVQVISVLDRAGKYSSGCVPKLRIIFEVLSRVETLRLLAPYFLWF